MYIILKTLYTSVVKCCTNKWPSYLKLKWEAENRRKSNKSPPVGNNRAELTWQSCCELVESLQSCWEPNLSSGERRCVITVKTLELKMPGWGENKHYNDSLQKKEKTTFLERINLWCILSTLQISNIKIIHTEKQSKCEYILPKCAWTYSRIKTLWKLPELCQRVSQQHVRVGAVEKNADYRLGGTGIVYDLRTQIPVLSYHKPPQWYKIYMYNSTSFVNTEKEHWMIIHSFIANTIDQGKQVHSLWWGQYADMKKMVHFDAFLTILKQVQVFEPAHSWVSFRCFSLHNSRSTCRYSTVLSSVALRIIGYYFDVCGVIIARWPETSATSLEVYRSKTQHRCCLVLNLAGLKELISRLICDITHWPISGLQSGDVVIFNST